MHVDNIIVMEYVDEKYPIQVIELYSAIKKYKDFNINLDNNTWDYGNYKGIEIGNRRSINFNNEKSLQGIIGVYDKTSMAHLNNETKHVSQIIQNLQLA